MSARVGLTAARLLDLVDAGSGADAAWRGRLLAGAAAGELSSDDLDRMSLGMRDAWILALRCGAFGDTLPARITCPGCNQLLTVRVPRDEVARQAPSPAPPPAPTVRVEAESLVVEARARTGRCWPRPPAAPTLRAHGSP